MPIYRTSSTSKRIFHSQYTIQAKEMKAPGTEQRKDCVAINKKEKSLPEIGTAK
jgi:hypothetical protein